MREAIKLSAPKACFLDSRRAVTAALAFIALALLGACSPRENAVASVPAVPAAANESSASPVASPVPSPNQPLPHFNGEAAMQYVRTVVGFGPRWVGSPGHEKLESYLRTQLKADNLEEDSFTASTPVGVKAMRNFIAKFPGTKNGIIVVAGHYDTLYGRPDFVGANDGGSSTGLPLEFAKELRSQLKNGKRDGYSVWLVWLDGEEAFKEWTDQDSIYGSRHLAEKWQTDGTLSQLKAFLLVDMVGDADLNIDRDSDSTPSLEDLVFQSASRYGFQSHFFARTLAVGDDHQPFVKRGVPSADLIDFDYGYDNAFWHTRQDTLDKLSPKSLEIVGSVVEETVRTLDSK